MRSQEAILYEYLKSGREIDKFEARKLGIDHLQNVVESLKKYLVGYRIRERYRKDGAGKVRVYWMEKKSAKESI